MAAIGRSEMYPDGPHLESDILGPAPEVVAKSHLDKLKEILDRKCNLQYDIEEDEMREIDSELRKLYNIGDQNGKS